jgi:hypothetical protein
MAAASALGLDGAMRRLLRFAFGYRRSLFDDPLETCLPGLLATRCLGRNAAFDDVFMQLVRGAEHTYCSLTLYKIKGTRAKVVKLIAEARKYRRKELLHVVTRGSAVAEARGSRFGLTATLRGRRAQSARGHYDSCIRVGAAARAFSDRRRFRGGGG